MAKKSKKIKNKINEAQLAETLKKGLIKKSEQENKSSEKKEVREIKNEPTKQVSSESFTDEFEEFETTQQFTPISRSPFSLEHKIMPTNPINLEQIGEQEPNKNENGKKDTPYTVKYDSSNYKTNKHYEVNGSTREESNSSNNSPAGQPRNTFDKIYTDIRPEQETSGIEDLRASEEGYKLLNKKKAH